MNGTYFIPRVSLSTISSESQLAPSSGSTKSSNDSGGSLTSTRSLYKANPHGLSVSDLQKHDRHHQLIAKNVIASALWAHQDISLPQVHSYANYNKILAQNYHQNNDSRVQGKSDTKDFDTVSIASSTRFTLVNGMGRFDESPKRRGIFRTFYKQTLCNRSHQISVLILTMSFIFLVGIIFAIYLLEVRARDLVRTQQ